MHKVYPFGKIDDYHITQYINFKLKVSKMSKMSKIVEYGMKRKFKEGLDDKDKADAHMNERSLVEDEIYKLPKIIYRTKVESKDIFGCQMVIFNENENTEHIVIYLHGGAYVDEITLPHIAFCDKIAKKTNSTVYTPIYPLAPNHTAEETYPIVEELYKFALEIGKPITIMGDSSGGGLSAAFCEYLAANEMAQPKHLILISPWVDVSMSGDYDDYVESDPMSGVEGLREMGITWAGDLDPKDYRVSPLFGDVCELPETTIFIGTHEQIYPDVTKFYKKLKENGVDVQLIVGEGMTHVYPIYPLVPESKEALNQIVEIILG
jgi:acetyl esterase/lipase